MDMMEARPSQTKKKMIRRLERRRDFLADVLAAKRPGWQDDLEEHEALVWGLGVTDAWFAHTSPEVAADATGKLITLARRRTFVSERGSELKEAGKDRSAQHDLAERGALTWLITTVLKECYDRRPDVFGEEFGEVLKDPWFW